MVLMHDIKWYTRDALRRIIRYGKDNGYTFANPGREGSAGVDGAEPTGSEQPVTSISWRELRSFSIALTSAGLDGTISIIDKKTKEAVQTMNAPFAYDSEYLGDDQKRDPDTQLHRGAAKYQKVIVIDDPEGIVNGREHQTVQVDTEIEIQRHDTGHSNKAVLKRSRILVVDTIKHDHRQIKRRHQIHLEPVIILGDLRQEIGHDRCHDAVDVVIQRILFHTGRQDQEEYADHKINDQKDPLCISFFQKHTLLSFPALFFEGHTGRHHKF